VGKIRRKYEDFVKIAERLLEKFYNFHTIYTPRLYSVLIHLQMKKERITK